MAKRLTKKEKLQREYNRQIKRIAKRLEQLEDQGYNTAYTSSKVEQVPKRITDATIRKLKAITPKFIREHSSYVDYHTGELQKPKSKAARKYLSDLERFEEDIPTGSENWGGDFSKSTASQANDYYDGYTSAPENQPVATDTHYDDEFVFDGDAVAQIIIDNFYADIDDFPQSWVHESHRKFDAAIEQYGVQKVAEALQSMPESFHTFCHTHKYASDEYVEQYYQEFLNYLDLTEDDYKRLAMDGDGVEDVDDT